MSVAQYRLIRDKQIQLRITKFLVLEDEDPENTPLIRAKRDEVMSQFGWAWKQVTPLCGEYAKNVLSILLFWGCKFFFVNQKFRRLSGMKSERMQNISKDSVIPGENVSERTKGRRRQMPISEVRQGAFVVVVRLPIVSLGGQIYPFSEFASPLVFSTPL